MFFCWNCIVLIIEIIIEKLPYPNMSGDEVVPIVEYE